MTHIWWMYSEKYSKVFYFGFLFLDMTLRDNSYTVFFSSGCYYLFVIQTYKLLRHDTVGSSLLIFISINKEHKVDNGQKFLLSVGSDVK